MRCRSVVCCNSCASFAQAVGAAGYTCLDAAITKTVAETRVRKRSPMIVHKIRHLTARRGINDFLQLRSIPEECRYAVAIRKGTGRNAAENRSLPRLGSGP